MNKFTYLLLLLFCMMGGGVTKAYAEIGDAYDTSSWTITASSNAPVSGNEGEINKAFDGNKETFWHSDWRSDKTDPKWIVIDTKSTETSLGGFTYLPRQDNDNGIWLSYKIYVSNTEFTNITKESVLQLPTDNLKKEGTLAENREKKTITLDNEVTGRYILIVITDGKGNNIGKHATCAELTVNKYVDASQVVNVTYTYQLSGTQTTKTKTVKQIIGTAYQAPAPDVDFVTFTQPQGTVQVGENQVTVQCTENLPFPKTTDLNNAKWCNITMHSGQNYKYVWQYKGENQDISTAEKPHDYNLLKDKSLLWCFKGNAFDGFEIYNLEAGTINSLNTTDGNPQITSGNHTKWFLKTSEVTEGRPCFTSNHTNYLNPQGDVLKTWNEADHGSTCRIFAPADWVLTKAENIVNIPTGAVGGYTNDEVIDTPLSVYEKDLFNIENAIALGEALATLQSNGVELTVGGYYRIVSAYPNYKEQQHVQKCMLSLADNEYIKWGNLDLKDINNVFQLDKKSNDKYCLKNANRNAYMQGVKGLLGNNKENAADMDFVELGEAQYNIHYSNGNCHTEGHSGGAGHNGSLVAWDGGQNTASAWYIVKADTVEVALNTAGDASYATTYLPFSVSNVEGATAYIGKKVNERTLQATAIKAGIPDNQGVILKGAANAEKAVLTLGKATSNVKGNALKGTLVEKDYTNELVFGVNNNVVGFYSMATGKKIGANKAYLEAAARAMKLVFDGDVTGIENVMGEAADANAPIYDLTGRRVMKAVKGGLYIQNGKKFIAQ